MTPDFNVSSHAPRRFVTHACAVWRMLHVEGRTAKVGLVLRLSGGFGPDGLALNAVGNLPAAWNDLMAMFARLASITRRDRAKAS